MSNPIIIDGYNVSVNDPIDEISYLRSFDELKLLYTGTQLYLNITDGNMISKYNIPQCIISDIKKINDPDYIKKYCEQKNKLSGEMIKNLYSLGFELPSSVQSISILPIIAKRNLRISFKSGTGKTLAFLLGSLWHFDPSDPSLQIIIISVSREVAVQIHQKVIELCPRKHTQNATVNSNIVLCTGQKKETGSFNNKSASTDLDNVKTAQIIVGTIGRIYDLSHNYFFYEKNNDGSKNKIRMINYDNIKVAVFDEYDQIVYTQQKSQYGNMTSEQQVNQLIKLIPEKAQLLFFSATINNDAIEITDTFFNKHNHTNTRPFIVSLNADDFTLSGIKQYYVIVNDDCEKKEILDDILKTFRLSQGIIFANTKARSDDLKNWLTSEREISFSVEVFHSDMSTAARDNTSKMFIESKIKILIATNVLAKGFDVQSINLVVNYDMPNDMESYIHRSGRSGRYGRKGLVINFVHVNKSKNINELLKVDEINKISKDNKLTELPGDIANL